jgi:ribosomal protein L11 methylase PrmA
MANLDKEVSEQLQVRLEYECRLVTEYFKDDWTVRHGPFRGMRYAPMTSGCLMLIPEIIASYENFIHQWIVDAINQNYETILNIGCGEGYYAVGFSLKSKTSHVYAYDTDKEARHNVAALAQLNPTADSVHLARSMREQNTPLQHKYLPFAFWLRLSAAGMGYRSCGGGLVVR